MKDCHYRRTPTILHAARCEDSKKMFQLKNSFELRDLSKQRNQIDSVYILPKVKFVDMNGTEIPVLDENIFKKNETTLKTESTILTEV